MIPRIIHQTWTANQIPENFRAFSETWKKRNPEWDYRFWTDRGLLEFVATCYPAYLDLFCSYRKGVQRADAGRYMLMHHFGGVYADLDEECLRPFDPLTSETRVILCREPESHWAAASGRGLPMILFSGVIVSPAKHPFWLYLLDRIAEVKDAGDVLDSTGPFLLTGALLSYPEKKQIRVENETFFCSIDRWGNISAAIQQAACYAVHHWAGTWWRKKKTKWWRRKVASLAKRFYSVKADIFAGKRLDPRIARTAVSPEAVSAPLPEGKNIAILIPARDVGQHLNGLFASLSQLTVPKDRIKLVFCEGDSQDDTCERLVQLTAPLKPLYREIILLQKNIGTRFGAAKRQASSIQRVRRAGLAKVRNYLIDHGLDDSDDWALWIDADVWRFPADIIEQLINAKAKIVVPNCVILPGGRSFDLNSFIALPRRRDYRYLRMIKDGLFQPPANYPFRLKLSDLRYCHRVPLDSVGGTMLLVDAALHRGGLRFPELPYNDLIETEAFGCLAKDCGITPIGLPRVEILHVPW